MIMQKVEVYIYPIVVLMALVVIIDYILPGQVVTDEILEVRSKRQQYYNAARNYHYSYMIITSEDQFYVSEDFAEIVTEHDDVSYSRSSIFREVNWYRLSLSQDKTTYPLRLLLGLILPLLAIASVAYDYRNKRNFGILFFVLQVLLLADLILLVR